MYKNFPQPFDLSYLQRRNSTELEVSVYCKTSAPSLISLLVAGDK